MSFSPPLQFIAPTDRLAPFVASMWEWNVDAGLARSVIGKLLPSIAPQFAFHYGAPLQSDRGGHIYQYQQMAAGIQTEPVTVKATGDVRAIMVDRKSTRLN